MENALERTSTTQHTEYLSPGMPLQLVPHIPILPAVVQEFRILLETGNFNQPVVHSSRTSDEVSNLLE
jgi:hypothetical protein